MRLLIAHVFQSGQMTWEVLEQTVPVDGDGLIITFPHYGKSGKREALDAARRVAEQNRVTWLRAGPPGAQLWSIDLDQLRQAFPDDLGDLRWLRGTVTVQPELERRDFFGKEKISLDVAITKEMALAESSNKVFLSHKGANKPLVRSYRRTLEACGVDVWLDEDALPAGANLERALRQGFRDSCAAVFFITPDFSDEGYLATEIEYAVAEKRSKGDNFSIITLLLPDDSSAIPEVPELLRPFVWKHPESHLDGLREILRALPLQPELRWKSRAQGYEPSVATLSASETSGESNSSPAVHNDALRVLRTLITPERQTVEVIAVTVGLSEQVVRHHLETLAEQHLVGSQHFRARPTQYYLTKEGRAYLFSRNLLA